MRAPASTVGPSIGHYENFPVASWLCPPRLRPAIAAIYWFARTADDLADEGSVAAVQRLADLDAYGSDLQACLASQPVSPRWRQVFQPLGAAVREFALPHALLADLLSAFRQDVVRTRDHTGYADRADLLDYCSRSANPIGRLLLHLYGVREPAAFAESDCICSALQLTNFWQDLSADLPRGRFYLPAQDCVQHGLDPLAPSSWPSHPNARALLAAEVAWAEELMLQGAPLVRRVRGRAGWELRFVVQGGLRVLDRIRFRRYDSFHVRPQLRGWDAFWLLWRAIQM